MRIKWLILSIVIIVVCLSAIFWLATRDFAAAATDNTVTDQKVESTLVDQVTSQGSADFIVRFAEQADLSAAYAMDWDARGEYVYNTLRDTAARSQADAKLALDAQGLAYQTFIAGNELYVWGSQTAATRAQSTSNELTVLNTLAAMPEVSSIRATRTYSIEPSPDAPPRQNKTWAGELLARHALVSVDSSTSPIVDWGITDSKADQFWSAFGVKGDGVLVANIDTGVEWSHPALFQAYKCSMDPANPSCWDDPSNICGGSPCDNQGHGTHTMGTMVASDDPSLPYTVGMAPNAKWIACKGCESTSCSEFALNACADWILAPGGYTVNRPNIVNNSWGDTGGNPWFESKVQAWLAAGIFSAFSAGNSGAPTPKNPTGCNSLSSPGDYQESFASAAHDSSRNIASFSSRGPSAFGDNPYTKPNLSAPGVSIYSTYYTPFFGNTYLPLSGTSMASPHTAGAVALLWSCNSSLIGKVDETAQVLQNSADPPPVGSCGAPSDGQGNYTYGYGYLNVFQAGVLACNNVEFGSIEGHVLDQNGVPISGVTVTSTYVTTQDQIQAITNSSGYYTMRLPVGTYNLTARLSNLASQTIDGVDVSAGGTTTQDFHLQINYTYIFLPLINR